MITIKLSVSKKKCGLSTKIGFFSFFSFFSEFDLNNWFWARKVTATFQKRAPFLFHPKHGLISPTAVPCVAGVKRGRGNLGGRERVERAPHALARPNSPLLLPLLTPATQATTAAAKIRSIQPEFLPSPRVATQKLSREFATQGDG